MAQQNSPDDDLEKLFIDDGEVTEAAAPANPAGTETSAGPAWEVPPMLPDPSAPPVGHSAHSLPVRQQRAAEAAARRGDGAAGSGATGMRYEHSTVLESDFASLAREARGIARNLKLVCNPLMKEHDMTAMLQHWDLWGPLMFTLLLASLLSLGASNKEVAFCVVFVVVIVGAQLLTANVVLLGGSVSFFQSLSLLGYCLFPIDVAAIVAFFVRNWIVRIIVIVAAMAWALRAAVPFVAGSVGDQRRLLAVFPLTLMYTVLGWLTFIS